PVRGAAPAAPPPVVSALRPAGARRRCPAAWGPPGAQPSRFRPGEFSETVGHPVDRPGARPPPALRLPRCGSTSPWPLREAPRGRADPGGGTAAGRAPPQQGDTPTPVRTAARALPAFAAPERIRWGDIGERAGRTGLRVRPIPSGPPSVLARAPQGERIERGGTAGAAAPGPSPRAGRGLPAGRSGTAHRYGSALRGRP